MPLSEHEQRMLDEIESALYAEDPKFATSVRRTAAFGGRRPTVLVVVLGLVGLALLLGGLVIGFTPAGVPVVSILGFLVLFAAGVLALRGRPATDSSTPTSTGSRGGARRQRPRGGYASRMEDRFRRRFEQPGYD